VPKANECFNIRKSGRGVQAISKERLQALGEEGEKGSGFGVRGSEVHGSKFSGSGGKGSGFGVQRFNG
jgi:hypothetical protein